MFYIQTEQFLPISIEEAWDFFSNPKNLIKLTPPDIDFRILSDIKDIEIHDGMELNYSLKPILGITIQWETIIHTVRKHQRFTDIQIKGPFKTWQHTHIFEEINSGVIVHDLINYEVPFGIIGKFANHFFVRNKIESNFKYRKQVLNNIFQIN